MNSIQGAFKIPELKNKILITIALIIVYRIGGHVPVPGIDTRALGEFFAQAQGTLFGLYDMFAGGAFQKATIFAVGIMPYISASIIIQLLGSVVPYFQKLQREAGEEGRKKINQYTRYGTVFIAIMQSYGISVFLMNIKTASGASVVPFPGPVFILLTIITLTAGSVFVMWLGEMITEVGIGNGISLIIFIGILARFPNALIMEVKQVIAGNRMVLVEIFLFALIIVVTALVIFITQGHRRIPVQYAKRIIGRKVYGGQNTHIPLKIVTAGVIPIIFAQSLMFIPSTISTFFPENDLMQTIAGLFSIQSGVYWLFYGLLIIFFTYFYTAIIFNPVDLADNMRKQGGFIPGIRPGKRTSEFIDNVLTKVTLPGSIFLALIAILPFFIMRSMNVSYDFSSFFGGTGLLIVVGVALDTLQQVESQLMVRHYDGFMKKGKIKGRRGL